MGFLKVVSTPLRCDISGDVSGDTVFKYKNSISGTTRRISVAILRDM